LTKKAVVEDAVDGRELTLKSSLHRDCFKRSIITRCGSCGGGDYGGEESSIEVEKRFRDGCLSRFGLACLALIRINKAGLKIFHCFASFECKKQGNSLPIMG
jgi:hypothetical protein